MEELIESAAFVFCIVKHLQSYSLLSIADAVRSILLLSGLLGVLAAAVTCFSSQAEKMRAQLASLPPLHVTKLPSRDSGRPEVVSSALYRKTDQLLETLLQMSANVKVVDITGKSPGS